MQCSLTVVINHVCSNCSTTTSIIQQYKFSEYKQSTAKENWSPTSKRRYNNRVFTDSTEKAAADEFDKKYVETSKPRDTNDLAALLMMIHNQNNPASVVISVSHSTLTRIKQYEY